MAIREDFDCYYYSWMGVGSRNKFFVMLFIRESVSDWSNLPFYYINKGEFDF